MEDRVLAEYRYLAQGFYGMLKQLIYAGLAAVYGYGLYWDLEYIPMPDPSHSKLRKTKFLTFCTLAFNAFYFNAAALRAFAELIFGKPRRDSSLIAVLDFAFHVAFTLGWAVALLFWGLYAIDRELIFPVWLEKIIPPWENHVMHTLPVASSLADSFLTHHRPQPVARAVKTCILINIAYTGSLIAWRQVDGHWVYPVFEHLSPGGIVAFIGAASLLTLLIYFAGAGLNAALWAKENAKGGKKKTR